mmetsp:Transcript_5415/g.8215  ORF Transcript_5415/g.8215 Transcript_5415/m.8215 type:complete len:85 (+) Transcript_5415:470-724(+)
MTGSKTFICPVPSTKMTHRLTVERCIPASNDATPRSANVAGVISESTCAWKNNPAAPPNEAPIRTDGVKIPEGSVLPYVIVMRT